MCSDTGRRTCQHLTHPHVNTTLVIGQHALIALQMADSLVMTFSAQYLDRSTKLKNIRGPIANAHMHPAQEDVAHLRLGGIMPAPMAPILLPERSRILQAPTPPWSGAPPRMHQAQEHTGGAHVRLGGSTPVPMVAMLLSFRKSHLPALHTSTHRHHPRQLAACFIRSQDGHQISSPHTVCGDDIFSSIQHQGPHR